jgi:hypothetical protein
MADRAKVHADWPTRELGFWCPGCQSAHWVPTAGERAWTWNGSLDSPTLSPSILRYEMPTSPRCHSFLKDGKIQFLPDCQHALAGTTVDAPLVTEWPAPRRDADG